MSNQDDKKKGKLGGAPQLTDMILGNLKPRVGKETTKWVAGLTDEAIADAEHEARMQGVQMLTSSEQVPPRPAQIGVVQFMDYLFDCFQQYEFEFNRSAPAPELSVTVERPTAITETIRHSLKSPETRQVFRGRISTQYWTLLLRGYHEEVEGYLLPIDQLISFASDPLHYTKFLSLTGTASDDDISWSVDGVEVSWDKIRSLGKQLFAALVHVAKTGTAEGLVFAFSHKEPAVTAGGDTPAKQASYDFNAHDPALDDMGYTVPGRTAPAPAPAPAPVKPAQAKSTSVSKIETALDQLQKALTEELDDLTKAGQEAFGKQDMANVERIVQRTNKVKQLRDQMNVQIATWKAALRSD